MAAKKSKPAKKPAPKKPAPAKRVAPVKKGGKVIKKPVKPAAKPAAKAAAKSVKPVVKKQVKPQVKVAKPPVKAAVAPRKPAATPGKPIIRTGPSIQPRAFGRPPISAMGRNAAAPGKVEKAKPLSKKDLDFHRDLLLKLRDRVIDEISFLANDNLNRSAKDSSGDLSSYSFHMADQGTDNFDREFAASLLNNEHDVLYEIEEALRRIDQGTYGICEMSGQPIERERLKALPFARYSVAVQSEMERGKPRFRPFRRTSSIQGIEAT
ncbi:MAG TPA: TraR/DksA C4-type zinc finger protein [Kiritimatiellia bacterium]|nr:TraR/DksA C4-type zinc finger protein [Kiritimatiellia bacterium]HMP34698.1 TraR/DksA C4-type zinc finger protein [Kiritimatiellia bacterium]